MINNLKKICVTGLMVLTFISGAWTFAFPQQVSADTASTINQFYDFSKPFYEGCKDGIAFTGLNGDVNKKYTCGFKDFQYYFGKTLKLMIAVGIVVSTLSIAWAGFMLIYSQGNPGELTKARKRLGYVILGFFFMLTAFLIVKFILTSLGVDSGYYSKFIGS